jgi:hypothetical protein
MTPQLTPEQWAYIEQVMRLVTTRDDSIGYYDKEAADIARAIREARALTWPRPASIEAGSDPICGVPHPPTVCGRDPGHEGGHIARDVAWKDQA